MYHQQQQQHHPQQQQQHLQYQLQQDYQQQNDMMQQHQRQDLMQMTENMSNFYNNDGTIQQHPQEVCVCPTQIIRIAKNSKNKNSSQQNRTLVSALMMTWQYRIVMRVKRIMKCQ